MITVTHNFVSTIPDDPAAVAAGEVVPSNWNDTHSVIIPNGSITNAMLANAAVAGLSGTNTGDQVNISGNASTVTTNANLTGVVTSVGNATAIANGAITNAMLANSAVASLSGTNTGDQTNITGNAATVSTINGRIAAGTNVAITGSGTAGSPYTITSTGGSAAAGGSATQFQWNNSTALDGAQVYYDSSNVRVGVNKNNPNILLDLGGLNATNTVGTSAMLQLTRPITGGVAYPQVATIGIGTPITVGVASATRLDINLKNIGSNNETADANVMTLWSNGRVGINTTTPTSELQVVGTATVDNLTVNNGFGTINCLGPDATDTNTVTSFFQLTRPIMSGRAYAQVFDIAIGNYSTGFGPNTRADFRLKSISTNPTVTDMTVMTLQSNGRVGINKTSPATALDVSGTITCDNLTIGSGLNGLQVFGPGARNTQGVDSFFQLTRPIQAAVSFAQVFGIEVGAYQTNSPGVYNPVTRADFCLKSTATSATPEVADVTVMTLQANGYVGTNQTSPLAMQHINTNTTTAIGCIIQGVNTQTGDLQQWQNNSATVLTNIKADGSIGLPTMTDAAATNNSLYFSSTTSKLTYKDSTGTLHAV